MLISTIIHLERMLEALRGVRPILLSICLLLLLAAGCQVIDPSRQQQKMPTVAPSAVAPATQEAEALAATSTPTDTPAGAGEAVAVTPAPQGLEPELAYSQPFDLVKSKSALGGCHQESPLALPAEGLVPLALLTHTRLCKRRDRPARDRRAPVRRPGRLVGSRFPD